MGPHQRGRTPRPPPPPDLDHRGPGASTGIIGALASQGKPQRACQARVVVSWHGPIPMLQSIHLDRFHARRGRDRTEPIRSRGFVDASDARRRASRRPPGRLEQQGAWRRAPRYRRRPDPVCDPGPVGPGRLPRDLPRPDHPARTAQRHAQQGSAAALGADLEQVWTLDLARAVASTAAPCGRPARARPDRGRVRVASSRLVPIQAARTWAAATGNGRRRRAKISPKAGGAPRKCDST